MLPVVVSQHNMSAVYPKNYSCPIQPYIRLEISRPEIWTCISDWYLGAVWVPHGYVLEPGHMSNKNHKDKWGYTVMYSMVTVTSHYIVHYLKGTQRQIHYQS